MPKAALAAFLQQPWHGSPASKMGWLALALLVLAGALVARAALFAAQLGVQLRQLRKLPSPRLGILGIDSWRDKVSGTGAAWRTARCLHALLAVPLAGFWQCHPQQAQPWERKSTQRLSHTHNATVYHYRSPLPGARFTSAVLHPTGSYAHVAHRTHRPAGRAVRVPHHAHPFCGGRRSCPGA